MKIVILMCLLSASAILGKPLTYSSDLQNASDLVAPEIHVDKPVNQPENIVADDQQQTDVVEPEQPEEKPEEFESDEYGKSDESDESEEEDDEAEIREEPPRREVSGPDFSQENEHDRDSQPSRGNEEQQDSVQDHREESDRLQSAQQDRERHGQRSQQQAQTKVIPEQGHFQVPDLSQRARDTSDQPDREGVHLANLNIVINV